MNENILHHKWCESNDDFFKRIDKFGGWPVGRKYIQYYHGDDRQCVFNDVYVRDEWNTTIATADEYYKWKLSPEAIKQIKLECRREIIRELSGFPCF